MSSWLRLQTDLFSNPDIEELLEEHQTLGFAIFILALCRAKQRNSGGELSSKQWNSRHIARALLANGDMDREINAAMKTIERLGLVSPAKDGKVMISNWSRYQIDSSNAERQARFRQRKLAEGSSDEEDEEVDDFDECDRYVTGRNGSNGDITDAERYEPLRPVTNADITDAKRYEPLRPVTNADSATPPQARNGKDTGIHCEKGKKAAIQKEESVGAGVTLRNGSNAGVTAGERYVTGVTVTNGNNADGTGRDVRDGTGRDKDLYRNIERVPELESRNIKGTSSKSKNTRTEHQDLNQKPQDQDIEVGMLRSPEAQRACHAIKKHWPNVDPESARIWAARLVVYYEGIDIADQVEKAKRRDDLQPRTLKKRPEQIGAYLDTWMGIAIRQQGASSSSRSADAKAHVSQPPRASPSSRFQEIEHRIKTNVPIDPEMFRDTIAEAIEDGLQIPDAVRQLCNDAVHFGRATRMRNGKIDPLWDMPLTATEICQPEEDPLTADEIRAFCRQVTDKLSLRKESDPVAPMQNAGARAGRSPQHKIPSGTTGAPETSDNQRASNE